MATPLSAQSALSLKIVFLDLFYYFYRFYSFNI